MTELLAKLFIKDYKNTEKPTVRQKYGFLSSIVGISVNLILTLIKLVIGILTFSLAVVADALNNLSDAGSSIVTFVSFKLSSKPADRDHPFGHARLEYIASMIVSFLILIVGFETLSKSFSELIGKGNGNSPDFSVTSIIILGSSILLKLWLSFFYRKIAKKVDSSVIKASSADSLLDCISTSAVLISSIIVKLTGAEIVDAIVGICVSFLILVAGIGILNETKNSILGEAPLESTVSAIKEIISRYPDIEGIHDLMVHNYGPNHYIASFHAEVDGRKDIFLLHDMIDTVEKQINYELGILCTIHMDPIIDDDQTITQLKEFVTEIAHREISEDVSIHDFRVVVGNTHTNMIFDIVLPFESKISPDEVDDVISKAVAKEKPDHYCVITVDRG